MMQRRPVLLVSSMAICLAFRLEGQFAPGGRQIWALELAGLAPEHHQPGPPEHDERRPDELGRDVPANPRLHGRDGTPARTPVT